MGKRFHLGRIQSHAQLRQLAGAAALWAALGCGLDERNVEPPSTAVSMLDPVAAAAGSNVGGGGGAGPGAGGSGMAPLAALPRPDKLDLLFMIDNSISMNDKQDILKQAVPDLMSRLVNPICLDAAGNEQPAPPLGSDCPPGQKRQFEPLADVHVGIVSSSMGDAGANAACPPEGFAGYVADRVDLGHLVGSLARSTLQGNAQGFLEWQVGTTALDAFTLDAQRMVGDVGHRGCGWEGSLESWYRFLIDPVPYRSLTRVPCADATSAEANCVQPAVDASGQVLLDDTVLSQRGAFLRDDSLVAIIMLSDENDCSIIAGEQNWVPFNITDSRGMFSGTTDCDRDANAKCCYSCLDGPPDGCSVNAACSADPANPNRLLRQQDGRNLRCFEQKRRFGRSFLYPTQRYVNALTQPQLCTSAPDLVSPACPVFDLFPNPLFQSGRPARRVFLGGIVGVPWQAIASDETARGALLGTSDVLRFKNHQELTEGGVWPQILGSPGAPWRAATASEPEQASLAAVLPSLPQMLESPQFPRPGVVAGNAINGRDFDAAQTSALAGTPPQPDDLQYACIFPLAAPRDCATFDPNVDDCDCYPGALNRPLCEQAPGVSTPGTVQYWAKAYPASRELEVLKDFGDVTGNSIVASICARNTTDASKADFGYRPAVAAIVERLQTQLTTP